eukprot:7377080-Prymnesium_polylepis.3
MSVGQIVGVIAVIAGLPCVVYFCWKYIKRKGRLNMIPCARKKSGKAAQEQKVVCTQPSVAKPGASSSQLDPAVLAEVSHQQCVEQGAASLPRGSPSPSASVPRMNSFTDV